MPEFKLPEVGEGISSGTVVGLLVSVGDVIGVDQPLLELETDKAVVEIPSTVAGVVERIAIAEGDEVEVGTVVLTVADVAAGSAQATTPEAAAVVPGPDEDAAGRAQPSSTPSSSTAPQAVERPSVGPASAPSPAPGAGRGPLPAAPSVRRLARELGVDLHAVQGSGVLGRIGAEDVRAYAEGGVVRGPSGDAQAVSMPAYVLPDFSAFGDVEVVPMNGIRKATVRSMTQAWSTVPMVTHFDVADATDFEASRKRHGAEGKARGVKLTPTAMLVKIVAAALVKFPDVNASIDVQNSQIVYKKYVNVGVAVDTEHGLLVPVIRHADTKNVWELAEELATLADKARTRKLAPSDMQGGNFSVSNLGGIGGTGFTPIVNPPDVAILGVARGSIQPSWDEATATFVPRLTMPLSLSYDHRLIDGAGAARFLRWICRAIEDPMVVLLEG